MASRYKLAIVLLAIVNLHLSKSAVEEVVPAFGNAIEGRDVSFHCYGSYGDTLIWLFANNTRIVEGGRIDLSSYNSGSGPNPYTSYSLQISSVRYADAGIYCCTRQISDPECASGRIADLTVIVPAVYEQPSKMQEGTIGEDAFIECRVSKVGSPPPQIVWYRDGHGFLNLGGLKFQANFSGLLINDFSLEDKGNYTCEYHQPRGTSFSEKIQVIDRISTSITIRGPDEVEVDSSLELRCTSPQGAEVVWVTPSGRTQEGGVINIDHVRKEDNGVYKCNVTYIHDIEGAVHLQAVHTVQVYAVPTPMTMTSDIPVVPGSTVRVRGSDIITNEPFPPLSYNWIRKDQTLQEGEKYLMDKGKGELKIMDFATNDGGEYMCKGYNGYGQSTLMYNIQSMEKYAGSLDPTVTLSLFQFGIDGCQSYSEQMILDMFKEVIERFEDECHCIITDLLLNGNLSCVNESLGLLSLTVVAPGSGGVAAFLRDGGITFQLASNTSIRVGTCNGKCPTVYEAKDPGSVPISIVIPVVVILLFVILGITVLLIILLLCKVCNNGKSYSLGNSENRPVLNEQHSDSVVRNDSQESHQVTTSNQSLPLNIDIAPNEHETFSTVANPSYHSLSLHMVTTGPPQNGNQGNNQSENSQAMTETSSNKAQENPNMYHKLQHHTSGNTELPSPGTAKGGPMYSKVASHRMSLPISVQKSQYQSLDRSLESSFETSMSKSDNQRHSYKNVDLDTAPRFSQSAQKGVPNYSVSQSTDPISPSHGQGNRYSQSSSGVFSLTDSQPATPTGTDKILVVPPRFTLRSIDTQFIAEETECMERPAGILVAPETPVTKPSVQYNFNKPPVPLPRTKTLKQSAPNLHTYENVFMDRV